MSASTEVELDVFSGRPNPAWALTSAEAEELERRLAALPRSPERELSTRLGYRGLLVRLEDGTGARMLRVQSGGVEIAAAGSTVYARDEGRALERWLIATGGTRVPDDVAAIVARELG